MKIINLTALITAFLIGNGQLAAQDIYQQDHNLEIEELYKEISTLEDHCEVPCGIYGDSLRISLIHEHSNTIAKAMKSIKKLSAEESMNINQLVRWVNNKEKHAEEIQEIVAQYFLHQRVKLVKDGLPRDKMAEAMMKYNNQLASLHEILVYAMKCKQGTDEENVKKMNNAINDFSDYYFHGHKH